MKTRLIILFASFAITPIFSQSDETFQGACPVTTTKANFSETQFAGHWYEVKRFTNALITGDCGNPTYNLVSGKNYNVSYPVRKSNSTSTLLLELKQQVVTPTPGKYDVYFNNQKETIPHFVLDTDYSSYAVVWGCVYNSTTRINRQRLFIYSRKNTMDTATYNKTTAILNTLKINVNKLQDVLQNNQQCGRGAGGSAAAIIPNFIAAAIIMLSTVLL